MPTTVRITFQGLMSFSFDREMKFDEAGNPEPGNYGGLTVLLLDDVGAHAMHRHEKRLKWAARVASAAGGQRPSHLPIGKGERDRRYEISLADAAVGAGVQVDPSFFEHVPYMSQFVSRPDFDPLYRRTHDGGSSSAELAKLKGLVSTQVRIPYGRLTAHRLTEYQPRGGATLRAAHARVVGEEVLPSGKRPRGCVAEEVRLELEVGGDGAGLDVHSRVFGSGTSKRLERLFPFSPGAPAQEAPPDTIDIQFTNLPPQSSRRTPWTTHFQHFFHLLREPEALRVVRQEHLDAARAALPAALRADWDHDVEMHGGAPCWPFLIVDEDAEGAVPPPFRDPFYRPICPLMGEF